MKTNVLSQMRDTHLIIDSEEYIVCFDKTLYIIKKSDMTTKNLKAYRSVLKGIVLPENRLLIDCGKQRAYIMLDLETGLELWRCPIPKSDYTYTTFVTGQDYHFVYDYANKKGEYILIQIDVANKNVKHFTMKNEYRCVSDLTCDEGGRLWSLQGHLEYTIDSNGEATNCLNCSNGIRSESFQEMEESTENRWRYTWKSERKRISHQFFGDADTVIMDDLTVFCLKDHSAYSMVENESAWAIPSNSFFNCTFIPNSNYVLLFYDNSNIIIDYHARKMVARYSVEPFHKGCLIGNDFWIGTVNGILQKPFPLVEEIPLKKHAFLM